MTRRSISRLWLAFAGASSGFVRSDSSGLRWRRRWRHRTLAGQAGNNGGGSPRRQSTRQRRWQRRATLARRATLERTGNAGTQGNAGTIGRRRPWWRHGRRGRGGKRHDGRGGRMGGAGHDWPLAAGTVARRAVAAVAAHGRRWPRRHDGQPGAGGRGGVVAAAARGGRSSADGGGRRAAAGAAGAAAAARWAAGRWRPRTAGGDGGAAGVAVRRRRRAADGRRRSLWPWRTQRAMPWAPVRRPRTARNRMPGVGVCMTVGSRRAQLGAALGVVVRRLASGRFSAISSRSSWPLMVSLASSSCAARSRTSCRSRQDLGDALALLVDDAADLRRRSRARSPRCSRAAAPMVDRRLQLERAAVALEADLPQLAGSCRRS